MAKVESKRGPGKPATRTGGWNPIEWFGGVKQEFNKITWTSKDELRVYTKVTVIATFAIGLGIYLTDLLIQMGLAGFGSLVKAFTS